jgi:uncharacterized protein (DUF111 family)
VCRFELLVRPERREDIVEACFRQTSTLGLRRQSEGRVILPRRTHDREGLSVKTATRPDGLTSAKAESDDLARLDTLEGRRAAARRAEAAVRGGDE